MKRDELQSILEGLHKAAIHDEESWADDADVRKVFAWLERLPAGCELVGLNDDDLEGPMVTNTEQRTRPYFLKTYYANPDDLEAVKR